MTISVMFYAQYYAVVGDGFPISDLHEYAKDLQRELVDC